MTEPTQPGPSESEPTRYVPPSIEVISLACEISSYAPDEDDTPLF
jgi:hypothetical protein